MRVMVWYTSIIMMCADTRTQLSQLSYLQKDYRALVAALKSQSISLEDFHEKQMELHKRILFFQSFFERHTREQLQLSAMWRDKLMVQSVSEFREGYAVVQGWDNKYWHINTQGNYLYTQKYDEVRGFSCGLAPVLDGAGEWYHIRPDGTELVSGKRYDAVGEFSEGYAWVKENGRFHFITTDGTRVDDEEYEDVSNCDNGEYSGKKGDTWFTVKVGEEKDPFYVSLFPEKVTDLSHSNKSFFLGFDGKRINNEEYDFATNFYEGVAVVGQQGVYRIIGIDGKPINDEEYSQVRKMNCGLFFVTNNGNRDKYIISSDGKRLTNTTYSNFISIDSLATFILMQLDGEKVTVDINGKVVDWWEIN